MRPTTTLAHLTDAHVTANGRRTACLKDRSVDILNDLVGQLLTRGVDCALFGGDNIDNRGFGRNDAELFVRTARAFRDWVCIVGNHEAASPSAKGLTKEGFAERVEGHGIRPGSLSFAHSVGDVRVVGIDTTLQGTSGGYVSPETMRFLAEQVHDAPEDHIVVLGHHLLHPTWEPYVLDAWDREYLVANRAEVTALLASAPKVRAYLCGHHHAARIQRIAARGTAGGFYHILTPSPVAFPCAVRTLSFQEEGILVDAVFPELHKVRDEARQAVLSGRKAMRYALLGARRSFLQYLAGRASDNRILLPYDRAPSVERAAPAYQMPTSMPAGG